jgi:hypothetical protein
MLGILLASFAASRTGKTWKGVLWGVIAYLIANIGAAGYLIATASVKMWH